MEGGGGGRGGGGEGERVLHSVSDNNSIMSNYSNQLGGKSLFTFAIDLTCVKQAENVTFIRSKVKVIKIGMAG